MPPARRSVYDGPEHQQVPLRPPFSAWSDPHRKIEPVAIDVDMASLIEACWAIGLETIACCQGRRSIKRWSPTKHAPTYVAFASSGLRRDAENSLYDAIAFVEAADRAGVGPTRHYSHWRFAFHPTPPYGHMVYFKPAYIEAITAALKSHQA